MLDWKIMHRNVIIDFLKFLNANSKDFILKGGTALMLCYNLDRFSEDVDLDALSSKKNIKEGISVFCKRHKINYRTAKDTDTVKRFMILWGRETFKSRNFI